MNIWLTESITDKEYTRLSNIKKNKKRYGMGLCFCGEVIRLLFLNIVYSALDSKLFEPVLFKSLQKIKIPISPQKL